MWRKENQLELCWGSEKHSLVSNQKKLKLPKTLYPAKGWDLFFLNSQPGQQFQQHRHRVAPVPRICPVGRMETPAQTDLSPLLHYFKNCWKIIFSEKSENTYQASEVSPALDYLFIAQSSKLLNFNPNLHMRQLRMKSWVIYQRVARKPSGSGGLSLEMPSFLH